MVSTALLIVLLVIMVLGAGIAWTMLILSVILHQDEYDKELEERLLEEESKKRND